MQDQIPSPDSSAIARLSKVTRLHLHDTIVEHLRELIVEGVLAPDAKLNERELCETLGVSRTPLREAIKVLAAEGLVEIMPNQGARVFSMTVAEIREIFELASGLEGFSGWLACQRMTPEELANIKAIHYAMLACHAKNDLPGYYAKNHMIHDRINLAANNAALRQHYLATNRRLQALRFRSNLESHRWDKAIQEHEAMIKALEAQDADGLSNILRQHLLGKRDSVLRMLKDASNDQNSVHSSAAAAAATGAPSAGRKRVAGPPDDAGR